MEYSQTDDWINLKEKGTHTTLPNQRVRAGKTQLKKYFKAEALDCNESPLISEVMVRLLWVQCFYFSTKGFIRQTQVKGTYQVCLEYKVWRFDSWDASFHVRHERLLTVCTNFQDQDRGERRIQINDIQLEIQHKSDESKHIIWGWMSSLEMFHAYFAQSLSVWDYLVLWYW